MCSEIYVLALNCFGGRDLFYDSDLHFVIITVPSPYLKSCLPLYDMG
jgi:hypothetical protein